MKKVLNSLLLIGLIILNLFWTTLCIYIFKLLKIDIYSFSNIIQNLIFILISIPIIVICYISYQKSNKKEFTDFIHNFPTYIKDNAKYWGIAFLIMFGTNLTINLLFKTTNSTNQQLIEQSIKTYPLYLYFSTVIFAPITEELIFRKGLSKVIDNKYGYIIASGLLFGLMHLISATQPIEYLYLISYGGLGIAFAIMYHKTKNIFVPITFHIIHNLVAFILTII
jgi:CAAX amino terminal protease family.